jgi:hypothetical protein
VPVQPALHEDDGVLAVVTHGRRGQAEDVFGLDPRHQQVERHGANVVAFVDDDLAVVVEQHTEFLVPRHGLHLGDVDLACRLGLAAPDAADQCLVDGQEALQSLVPLGQQFGAMDQHYCVHAAPGNQGRRRDGLADGRRSLP